MGERLKKHLRACLVMVLIFSLCTCTYVQASQSEVDRLKEESKNASQAVDDINSKKKEAEDSKNKLESQASDLSGQINSLNNQISTVTGEITQAEEDIAATEADIETLNGEISDIETSLDTQKEAMKLRIKYMYENKSTNTLVNFLECGSISEFLQRLEYMAQITTYDKDAVKKYKETQDDLTEKKGDVETKNAELSAYKTNLATKKSELGTLVGSTTSALDTTNSQIADTNAMLEQLEKQLEDAKAYEKRIQKQYMDAQLALSQKLAGEHGGYSGGYSTTDEETLLLAALIQAEADNQGADGRLAVGSVVMNRVASSKFPNTVSGVIYSPGQFAPVTSGRVALILANGPNSGCQYAAAQAIAGNTNTDALFFFTVSYAQNLHDRQVAEGKEGFLDRTEGTIINAHYFYNYK
ncbi:N-terminal domain of peptidoglycan hydrolase CwlO-containing protein [Pseudobutyrivibrio sp. YE44]|uniref:cell wall hydrolase n=1 Tax=Pseudobutyrivibrio sp. YE44 TaxID=1520802 RepID=UPI000889D9E5|nr:cell wall hydrolase [Pseudobutyrivibrio sp. YE44]SDB55050.1 N-terminal domain of peptidoglycan hydrolase CwlO-containing protein [Pseudobutyrivibrio sp. YE44]